MIIGRSGVQQVACSRAAAKLLLAPPRTFKTALIASWAAAAPGALVATSSRGDLWEHTAVQRRARGGVHILDADGDTGIGTNFRWSPVDGCGNPQTAIRRAGDFMSAASRDPSGRDAFHEERGARFLSYLLHGAAAAGAPMREVFWWAGDPLGGGPQKALRHENAYPGWALELDMLLDCDTVTGIAQSALSALGWMRDPVLSAVVNPGRDEPRLRPRQFAQAGTDSLYLIGMHREFGSFAPLFAAITADIFAAARHVAERSPGRRLAKPLTMALDELMTICPVPAYAWAAVAEGYRVELIAGVQSPAQMTARWGEHNAATFRDCCPVKLIGGGYDDPADLKTLSELCGTCPDTGQPVRTPQDIRLLRPWHALALIRGARPAEVKIRPAWKRHGYAPALVAGLEPELELLPAAPVPELTP